MEINRIVCAIDLSRAAQTALAYAAAFAHRYNAHLTVLHATPERADAVAGRVRRFCCSSAGRARPRVVVCAGGPADRMRAAAGALGADLVVVGARRASRIGRAALGAVARQMARDTGSSLLVVPPAAAPRAHPVRLDRILCAVDFSTSSLRAMQCATSLAHEYDAHLMVLQMIGPSLGGGIGQLQCVLTDYVRVPPWQSAAGVVRARWWVRWALPATAATREVVRLAADYDADLIVLGAAHPSDAPPFAAAADRVLRVAHCPVLSVRHPS
jgi:nucleotide-binding universal stress UspA family protein